MIQHDHDLGRASRRHLGATRPTPQSEETRRDQAATAAFGVASGVIGALVATFGRGTTLAVLVGLVTLCLTPGCALICWQQNQDRLRRVLAVLATSLTWTIVVATAFAWVQLTNLGALLVATSGVGGVGSAVFLLRERSSREKRDSEFDDRGREGASAGFRPGMPIRRSAARTADPERPGNARYSEQPSGSPYPGLNGRPFNAGPQMGGSYVGPEGHPRPDGQRYYPDPDRPDRTDPRIERRTRDENLRTEPEGVSNRHVWLIATLVIAIALFVFSVVMAAGRPVGSWGLLPVLGIPFFLAMVLTVVVLILALRSLKNTWTLAAIAIFLLLVECDGTPFMLDATPFFSYAYKHFGVVDYIFHGGSLNNPLDIYQQWPGFFSVGAALERISGRGPLSYANWAQLFYSTLDALVVFAIARQLSARRRIVPYITVLLVVTATWEGQFYYSPQATAFLLALLFQLLLLPFLQVNNLRRPFRNWRWLDMPPGSIEATNVDITAYSETARTVGIIAVFFAIVVTHQLTPYMIFGGLICLYLLGVLRNSLVVSACALIAFGYPIFHLPAIDTNSLITGFHFRNATGSAGFTDASSQALVAGYCAKAIGLGIWGVTAVCVFAYRRRLGIVLVPTVLAIVPLTFLLVSSYDGEGVYRAFLFSLPWCAIIISKRLADMRRAPIFRLAVVGAWTILAALGSAQALAFGLYTDNEMPASEIAAAAYFLNKAPVGAQLVLADSDFPSRPNARYALHEGNGSANDTPLAGTAEFDGNGLRNMSMESLAQIVSNDAGGDGYLAVSPTMIVDSDLYGYYSKGTLPALVQNMKDSSYWTLWYENDGTYIFKADPQGFSAGNAGLGGNGQ